MTDNQYDDIAQEYSKMLSPTKKYIAIPTFEYCVGEVQGKTALDLACGAGFFTRLLKLRGVSSLDGVDISEEMITLSMEQETKNPLGIDYFVRDVRSLDLGKTYEIISAVFLLNYSQSRNDLQQMCNSVYSHLEDGGRFGTITLNPHVKPSPEFHYERRITSVDGKTNFEDGDILRYQHGSSEQINFEFLTYYWSQQTYNECFEKAGFSSVEWVPLIIDPRGIEEYGNSYWDAYRQNGSVQGIVCKK